MYNLYPPRRYNSAKMLTAYIMQIINKHLKEDCLKRDIATQLEDLFYANGAEIITEADRIAAGLDPRNHNGLTIDDIRALDDRFIKSMIAPLPNIFLTNKE